jgi:hypothetical protein
MFYCRNFSDACSFNVLSCDLHMGRKRVLLELERSPHVWTGSIVLECPFRTKKKQEDRKQSMHDPMVRYWGWQDQRRTCMGGWCGKSLGIQRRYGYILVHRSRSSRFTDARAEGRAAPGSRRVDGGVPAPRKRAHMTSTTDGKRL